MLYLIPFRVHTNKIPLVLQSIMKYPQLVSMPTAVSDWLEEQLEARGIDAVVYTRYVLSLLYRDPIDVICPDQDLHFTQPDKVRCPLINKIVIII